jgi:hypothetical protein
VAADQPYLCEETVNGYPGVNVNDWSEKDAHKLVVVGDVYEVLEAEGHTWAEVDEEENPAAEGAMAQHREGADEDSIEKK